MAEKPTSGGPNVPVERGLDGAINVRGVFDRARRQGTAKQEKPKS